MRTGDKAPDFRTLLGVDGERHSLSEFDSDAIVVFSCNHPRSEFPAF